MKPSLIKASLFCLLAAGIFCLPACKEDTILKTPRALSIGNDSLSIRDALDVLPITSKTVHYDSMLTSLSNTGFDIYHGIGSISNPQNAVFGKTWAATCFQIVPGTTSFNFPANAVIDQAVLILPYTGFSYGDTTNDVPQTFNVYGVNSINLSAARPNDSFKVDSNYYAFQQPNLGQVLSETGVTVTRASLKDSVPVTVNGVTTMQAPHLRIPLSSTFINNITTILDNGGDVTLATFTNQFAGLCIQSDSNSQGTMIHYFRMNGTATDPYSIANVLFYYHIQGDTTTQTASFYFNTTASAHYNYISYTYGTGKSLFNTVNTTDSVVLLQNQPGAAIDITIPDIQTLPHTVINKAEIVLTQVHVPGEDTNYFAPARVFPVGVNDDGTTYTIQDRLPLTTTDGLNFIDGNIRHNVINNENLIQYVLNVPQELQNAISAGKTALHLRITGTQTFPGAYQIAIGGRNNSQHPILLHLVYSTH